MRITDHKATIIGNVNTNQVHILIKYCVVTLAISNRLGTPAHFKTNLNFTQKNAADLPELLAEFINFRNAGSMVKYGGLIDGKT